MNQSDYTKRNSETIDRWVENGWEWGIPISHEQFVSARQGMWDIVLTPVKPVPKEWFAPFYRDGRLKGVRILGLASGGGQQMPIMAALGARCTVLDYSARQLESEQIISEREGYEIERVQADMTKRLPFPDECFDFIIHPVSNCYVEDVHHVWKECFRVLRRGGVLIAGMDNGVNFLFDDLEATPMVVTSRVPFNPLKNPDQYELLKATDGGIQFSHTMEEQVGGQLKAGFVLTDLYEDKNSSGPLADCFPTYIATRSVKP